MRHLVVSSPFGRFGRGDHITDPVTVMTVLAGENSGHVRAIEADEPEPESMPVEAEPIPEPITEEQPVEPAHEGA